MNPPVPLTTVPDSASRSTNQNTAAVSTDQSKPSKSHRSDSEDNQSETVISRLHLSDKQKCVRDDFEAKRRKEARDDALKEKQRRKRVCITWEVYKWNHSVMHLQWLYTGDIINWKGSNKKYNYGPTPLLLQRMWRARI